MNNYLDDTVDYLINNSKNKNDFSNYSVVLENTKLKTQLINKLTIKLNNSNFLLPDILTFNHFAEKITRLKYLTNNELKFYVLKLLQNETTNQIIDINLFKIADIFINDINIIEAENVPVKKLFASLKNLTELDNVFKEEQYKKYQSLFSNSLSTEQLQTITDVEKLKSIYYQINNKILAKNLAYKGLLYRKLFYKINSDNKLNYQKIIFLGFIKLYKSQILTFEIMKDRGSQFYFNCDNFLLKTNHPAGLFFKQIKDKNFFKQNRYYDYDLNNDLNHKEIKLISTTSYTEQSKVCASILNGKQNNLIVTDQNSFNSMLNFLTPAALNTNFSYPVYNLFNNSKLNTIIDLFDYTISKGISKINNEIKYRIIKLDNGILFNKQLNINEQYVQKTPLINLINNSKLKYYLINNSQFENFIIDYCKSLANKENIDSIEYRYLFLVQNNIVKLKKNTARYKLRFSKALLISQLKDIINNLEIALLQHNNIDNEILDFKSSQYSTQKNITICNLNEENIPPKEVEDSFILPTIKLAFGISNKNDNAIYANIFYNLIKNANKINFIYIKNDNNEISRFIKQLEFLTSAKINYFKVADSRIQSNQYYNVNNIKLKNFQTTKQISASSLATFLTCELKFYFKYSKKLSTDLYQETSFELEFGKLAHSLLNSILKPYQGKNLDNLVNEKINLNQTIQYFFTKQKKINVLTSLKIKILETYVNNVWLYYKNYCKYKVLSLEQNYQYDIITNNNKKIKLTAIFDVVLVNEIKQKIIIVDYKTSKKSNFFIKNKINIEILEKLVFTENNQYNYEINYYIQTLVYLYIAKKNFANYNIEFSFLLLGETKNQIIEVDNKVIKFFEQQLFKIIDDIHQKKEFNKNITACDYCEFNKFCINFAE